MVQFATPEHQKGGKKKPKKEMGAWMDIVQMIAPIAASVVGTPLAGAAVSALLEGAESKLEGGSWKEALTKGAVSGGIGAITGGLAPGADKVAGEAVKQVGKGAVEEAGKKALTEGVAKEGAKQLGLGLATDSAGELVKNTAMNRAMESVGGEATKRFTDQMATAAAGGAANAAIAGGDASAKQRFFDHAQSLGEMGLDTYAAGRAEADMKKKAGMLQNQQLMQRIQGAMQGQYQPAGSRFYKPYGG